MAGMWREAEDYAEWCGEGRWDEPDMCEPDECLLTADDERCADGWECRERQQREAERIHEKRKARCESYYPHRQNVRCTQDAGHEPTSHRAGPWGWTD